MIDKLKKMYPEYFILIKRNGKLFDLCNKEVVNDNLLKRYSYIIVEENSYEVHPKVNGNLRRK